MKSGLGSSPRFLFIFGSEVFFGRPRDLGLSVFSLNFGSLFEDREDLDLPSKRLINSFNLSNSCFGICHSGIFNRDCIFGVFIGI